MRLVRVTAPEPILDVGDVKRWLNIQTTDFDQKLDFIVAAVVDATDGPDGLMGRALGPQTWDWYLNPADFWDRGGTSRTTSRWLEVPLPPLISVDAIEYRDTGDALAAYTTFDVVGARGETPARIRPTLNGDWPTIGDTDDALRIRFTAGYATSADPEEEAVPFDIKAAMMLEIGTLWEQPSGIVVGESLALTGAAERLLRKKRVHLGLA